MKMIVCIKQVPSTNEVRLDPETHTIIRDGRQSVINPFDSYALEEAVQIKEALGGTVTVLSMGIPATERLLRDACSRGADQGVLLTDRAFAGADTLATSYTLSLGVRQIGAFDLILCGKMAVDGDTAQIGPELAETLGIPHIADVKKIIAVTEQSLTCVKLIDGGEQELTVPLPALVTVVKDINMPRLPSIAGVRFSMEAPCRDYDAQSVQADLKRTGLNGSPTQVVRTFTPERRGEAIALAGSSQQQAAQIIEIING